MIKSKKKGIIGLTLTALAFVPLLAIGVTSFNNISPAYAADYDYNSERDGGEINENFDLTVTFTINNYDLAAEFTRYWTVYLLDENTEMVFDENSHKLSDSMSRHRNAATYFFPYRDTGIDKEGTWTLTVKADDKAYNSKVGDANVPDDLLKNDTGKTFKEVCLEQNWYVCVGPMYKFFWGEYYDGDADTTPYATRIDCYLANMDDIVAKSKIADVKINFLDDNNEENSNVESIRPGYYVLPECNFEAPEYGTFFGWRINNKGTIYPAGTKLRFTSNVNLYAYWFMNAPVAPKKNSLPVGAIVGIVVGGAVLLAGAVVLTVFLAKKRKA